MNCSMTWEDGDGNARGKATFVIRGLMITHYADSFTIAQQTKHMLEAAFRQGELHALEATYGSAETPSIAGLVDPAEIKLDR